ALAEHDIEAIFEDCLRSAVNRSIELSNQDND
ncbi:pyrroline-5-carboxylate reductase, partial [Mesorhizobium sp. M2D.F.Ca.ET.145.01.1.1]